jgi:hypothetical protein
MVMTWTEFKKQRDWPELTDLLRSYQKDMVRDTAHDFEA